MGVFKRGSDVDCNGSIMFRKKEVTDVYCVVFQLAMVVNKKNSCGGLVDE